MKGKKFLKTVCETELNYYYVRIYIIFLNSERKQKKKKEKKKQQKTPMYVNFRQFRIYFIPYIYTYIHTYMQMHSLHWLINFYTHFDGILKNWPETMFLIRWQVNERLNDITDTISVFQFLNIKLNSPRCLCRV